MVKITHSAELGVSVIEVDGHHAFMGNTSELNVPAITAVVKGLGEEIEEVSK